MSNKVNNTNGITQQFKKSLTISDRTHKSQLQYILTKVIDTLDYNSQQKRKLIETNKDWAYQHELEHKEKGTILDNDEIISRARMNRWKRDEIEVNNTIRNDFLQALEQLFPEEIQKSNSVADALAELQKSA